MLRPAISYRRHWAGVLGGNGLAPFLRDDPKNNRKDKSNCSKAEYVVREPSPIPGDEPVDPDDHHRPPQGGSLPTRAGWVSSFSRCECFVGVIGQFRVKAGELAEEADEAGWEPPRGRGAAISNGLAGRGAITALGGRPHTPSGVSPGGSLRSKRPANASAS